MAINRCEMTPDAPFYPCPLRARPRTPQHVAKCSVVKISRIKDFLVEIASAQVDKVTPTRAVNDLLTILGNLPQIHALVHTPRRYFCLTINFL
jgi:hypothetical protein